MRAARKWSSSTSPIAIWWSTSSGAPGRVKASTRWPGISTSEDSTPPTSNSTARMVIAACFRRAAGQTGTDRPPRSPGPRTCASRPRSRRTSPARSPVPPPPTASCMMRVHARRARPSPRRPGSVHTLQMWAAPVVSRRCAATETRRSPSTTPTQRTIRGSPGKMCAESECARRGAIRGSSWARSTASLSPMAPRPGSCTQKHQCPWSGLCSGAGSSANAPSGTVTPSISEASASRSIRLAQAASSGPRAVAHTSPSDSAPPIQPMHSPSAMTRSGVSSARIQRT